MNRPYGMPGNSILKRLEEQHWAGYLPRGWIDGLILSNDTTDATNDIAISAGVARSTVNIRYGEASTLTRDQVDLDLPVGIIKQLDVSWAPENYDPDGFSGGDRSGGRSSSSLANGTWHAYLIGGAGMPADVLFHDSVTQSSVVSQLPAGYTAYRRIGSVVRSSGSILSFIQRGDYFSWATRVSDLNTQSAATSKTNRALTVPVGIVVRARLAIDAAPSAVIAVLIFGAGENDASPSPTNCDFVASSTYVSACGVERWTDTSAQISYRASAASDLRLWTLGYFDHRDRDA